MTVWRSTESESTRRGARNPRTAAASVLVAVLCLGGNVGAQPSPDWTEPFPPFRIAGNLYYVGSKGLASYLIATPEGHILINRALRDGDEVKLGGTVLVAHLTPGHTKGCTTWTLRVEEGGETYDVVIVGSPNVNPGYRLVDNASYPQIAADYERTFRVLNALPCDILLGAHGSYFDLEAKYARLKEAGQRTPFIDPEGYRTFVAGKERAFRAELEKQRSP